MSGRKQRRNIETRERKPRPKANAKKQLVIMLCAVALMVFSVFQVYYLAKYTLGHEISSNKLGVYRWVKLLLDGDQTEDASQENTEQE